VSATQATDLRHQVRQRCVVFGCGRCLGKLGHAVAAARIGEQFVGRVPGKPEGHAIPDVPVLVHQQHVGDVEEMAEAELFRIAPC